MKKILFPTLGIVALVILVMLVRTFSYGSNNTTADITLPEAPRVDDAKVLEHLSQAIRFKTVTSKAGDPATIEAAQPWIAFHSWLAKTYPNTHQTLDLEKFVEYTLLFTWQGSDPSLAPIMLMAHQDVVPVDPKTKSQWTRPPFAGEVSDGYLYGRGALDDKASLIGIMDAVENLINSGFQPKRTVLLAFGHDEETSGSGAQAIVANLKERKISPEMVLDEGFFVIDNSPFAEGPVGFIGVAEKGYLTLKLVSEAAGGHSSSPPRNSANIQLAKALLALEENQMPSYLSSEPTANMFAGLASELSFAQKFAFANLWAMEGLIEEQLSNLPAGNAITRTTTAATMLNGSIKENVLPQQSSALINFRIHPKDTSSDVIKHVEKLVAKIQGVSVQRLATGGIASEPTPISATNNQSYAVLNSVAKNASKDGDNQSAPVVPALQIAATDSRYAAVLTDNIYRFVPIRITMADSRGIHGTDERISTGQMNNLVTGYMQIILSMDKKHL